MSDKMIVSKKKCARWEGKCSEMQFSDYVKQKKGHQGVTRQLINEELS